MPNQRNGTLKMRTCTRCHRRRTVAKFYRRRARDSWFSECIDCWKHRTTDPVARAEQNRRRRLKHQYGLTEAAYEDMLQEQRGVCAICRRPEIAKRRDGTVRRLAIDHNHETGEVRALLCQRCNHGIGLFADLPELMRLAADYLEEHGEVTCPSQT